MRRPPPVFEFKPDHTEGQIVGPPPADVGLGKYKRIVQFAVAGTIISIVATMMILTYYKARGPARLADCTGRLHILAQALEMYSGDHDFRMPPAETWRYDLSDYIDMVGGETEQMEDVGRPVKPRGFSSPMRCIANQTTTPISYFYLDPSEVRSRRLDDEVSLPVLVDEVHHAKTVVLRDDWSACSIDRRDWVRERQDTLRISRRPDWQNTFAYWSPAQQAQMSPTSSTSE